MNLFDERAQLADKVAVVAGGAGGLGRGVTMDLFRCGAAVAFCDIDESAVSETIQALDCDPDQVLARVIDVRDPLALGDFFEEFDQRFDRLDVSVTAVGGTFQAPFLETNHRGWEALIATNFTQVLDFTQHCASRMRVHGGSIVNITSIEGHRAAPNIAVYAAMKAAVVSLTRTLALELAPSNIRINCVAPDMVRTDATVAKGWFPRDNSLPADALAERIGIPMARMGVVEEVSNAVLYLASELSSYTTGTTIHVDGGTTASSGWDHWPEGYRVRPSRAVAQTLLDAGMDESTYQ